jgi:tyrosine decarboxylase/aspartate 1-decarboxylase
MLAQSRQAALDFYSRLKGDARFIVGTPPQLDIVVWMPSGETAREISQKAKKLFQACEQHQLFFALADLPVSLFPMAAFTRDQDKVTCLRACLMKPEHLHWLDEIWQRMILALEELPNVPDSTSTGSR